MSAVSLILILVAVLVLAITVFVSCSCCYRSLTPQNAPTCEARLASSRTRTQQPMEERRTMTISTTVQAMHCVQEKPEWKADEVMNRIHLVNVGKGQAAERCPNCLHDLASFPVYKDSCMHPVHATCLTSWLAHVTDDSCSLCCLRLILWPVLGHPSLFWMYVELEIPFQSGHLIYADIARWVPSDLARAHHRQQLPSLSLAVGSLISSRSFFNTIYVSYNSDESSFSYQSVNTAY